MGRPGRDKPVWIRFSTVGVEFAVAVAGFTLVGYSIDNRYDCGPWGTLIGVILGLVGGMYNLVRVSLGAVREGRRRRDGDSDGQNGDRRT